MRTTRVIFLLLLWLTLPAECPAQDKVAIIDTSIFYSPQRGITRLVKAEAGVRREFEPRRAELLEMHERFVAHLKKFSFTGPIPTDPAPMTPERKRRIKSEAEEMRRFIERQQEAAQRAYSQRIKEITTPIDEDIRRSLKEFAKARGIAVVLAASGVSCLIGCDDGSAASVDVTREFIAAYNRLNP